MNLINRIGNVVGPVNYPDILRKSGYHMTTSGLLAQPPSFTHAVVNATGGLSSYKQYMGMRILRFELHNVAAASAVGIGFRYNNHHMKVGRLSADGATYTDLTSTVLAGSAATVQVAGANQTGWVVGFPDKFNWVSTNFTTAETNAGGSTVADHAVQYSNAAGTDWTSTTAGYTDNFTTTNTVWAAGVTNLVLPTPFEWGKSASLGGLPDGYYWMRFTSAHREADDVAAVITGLEIGSMQAVKQLAQYGIYEQEAAGFASKWADGLVAYFGTADVGNAVYAEWEPLA